MDLVFTEGIGGTELKRFIAHDNIPIPKAQEKVMINERVYLVIAIFHDYDNLEIEVSLTAN